MNQNPLVTLKRSENALAAPEAQLQILRDVRRIGGRAFAEQVADHLQSDSLVRTSLDTLQVNVGKVCNQTCSHCHVDAGPDRRERMSAETAQHVIDFLRRSAVHTLDITGGAPELNPSFRGLVMAARSLGKQVIDRCNLTILMAPGFKDLPEFLAGHQVRIVASLPCYLEENCDAQRGEGVFVQSIEAIRRLNELGYGRGDSDLVLDLVYNPTGFNLPPPQARLEADYRRELTARYGIEFNRLLTITNMPVSRFLDYLLRQGQYETYMHKLTAGFNPQTISDLMCRNLVSVDWQGFLYDCDFNQMLDLAITSDNQRLHIASATDAQLLQRRISVANHCFGCTAGCGSSCSGSLSPSV